jgi:thioredoxin-dependent peroxiredoxin
VKKLCFPQEELMTLLQLGDQAPDFTSPTTEGELNLYDFLGEGWGIVFSHPADFTPVCTTELGRVAALKSEFEKRNTKVIAVSVDTIESHAKWSEDIALTQGTPVNFPIVADSERKVAELYGMIHPNASDTTTVRSVFVIGPDKKVKLSLAYPASTGRNFDEILRALDSLQLTSQHKVATPADWQDGDDVIIPVAIDNETATELFGEFTEHRPYLRTTKQPNRR